MMPELEPAVKPSSNRGMCAIISMAAVGVMLLCVVCCCVFFAFALATNEVVWFPDAETQTYVEQVNPDNATEVRVIVDAFDAELSVDNSSSDSFFVGTFVTNIEQYVPTIDYSERGQIGDLSVTQNSEVIVVGESTNEWNLSFEPSRALDLTLDLNSGGTKVEFADSALTRLVVESLSGDHIIGLEGSNSQLEILEAETNSGDVRITLGKSGNFAALQRVNATSTSGAVTLEIDGVTSSLQNINAKSTSGAVVVNIDGNWSEADFSTVFVEIESTSGSITVYLPDGVSLDVSANSTSGEITVDGVSQGDTYRNNANDEGATVTLRVELTATSGDIIIN